MIKLVIVGDINGFNEKVDTVIQNPPFGVKKEHADKIFLEKILQFLYDLIFLFHVLNPLLFFELVLRFHR